MTIKDAKLSFVTDCAVKLFLQRSISAVTIKDIARECGLGEATVYRYFSGKNELIVACAVKLQTYVETLFLDKNNSHAAGYKRIEDFYNTFLEIFVNEPQLYRFLSEFDAYCISENINGLDEYADNMDRFKSAFLAAYGDGVRDGSIREIKDIETFYYATTHAVLSLCKKLATQGSLLRQDALTDSAQETATLIEVILFSLKR